jgi:hypothetical protein
MSQDVRSCPKNRLTIRYLVRAVAFRQKDKDMQNKWIADEDELALVPEWLQEIIRKPLTPEEVAFFDEQARIARAKGKFVIGWPEENASY